MKPHILALAAVLTITACAQPSQNRYGYRDVGKATPTEFGKVVAARPIEITGENHNIGAAAGIGGGAIAGAQFGNGSGSLAAALAGAVVGGIIGNAAEQAIADHSGMEYTVKLDSGKTLTVAQNIAPDDQPIRRGDRVMVQMTGEYMRVLPASEDGTKRKGK